MKKLSLIDESICGDHTFINEKDQCYFAYNYTAYEGWSYSGTNQLIYNLKIKPDRKATYQWRYKLEAIEEVSELLKNNLKAKLLKKVVLVPIPPSKCKEDPLYDDRMTQVLKKAFGKDADIRELLIQKKSKVASHESGDDRATITELYNNLKIDKNLCDDIKKNIILIDDVITTGAHFVASRKKLKDKFPDVNVLGVFIARREIKKDIIIE